MLLLSGRRRECSTTRSPVWINGSMCGRTGKALRGSSVPFLQFIVIIPTLFLPFLLSIIVNVGRAGKDRHNSSGGTFFLPVLFLLMGLQHLSTSLSTAKSPIINKVRRGSSNFVVSVLSVWKKRGSVAKNILFSFLPSLPRCWKSR